MNSLSVTRPVWSLLARSATPASRVIQTSSIHTTSALSARKPTGKRLRFRYLNPEAKAAGVIKDPVRMAAAAQIVRHSFSPEEVEALREKYTPEQFEALMLSEESFRDEDLVLQGRLRNDPHRPEFLEDFTHRHPIIDVKPEVIPRESNYKFLSHHEYLDKMMDKIAERAVKEIPGMSGKDLAEALKIIRNTKDTSVDFTAREMAALENDAAKLEKTLNSSAEKLDTKALKEADDKMDDIISSSVFTDKHGNWKDTLGDMDKWGLDTPGLEQIFGPRKRLTREDLFRTQNMLTEVRPSYSSLADELGKINDMAGQYSKDEDPDDMGLDETGEYAALKQRTGLQVQDLLSVVTKVLSVRNVHNQTRLGKVRSVSVFAIAGNGDGRLGVGQAKSTDPMVATMTAKMLAIQNMVPIRRYENRTIYGTVKAKISGTVVELRARPPGFGLRVSHRIFEMCRAAGIHDLSAVIPRNKNPMNTVKAVFQALTNQPDPERIAIGLGKKLVDVRKVYFGGNVY